MKKLIGLSLAALFALSTVVTDAQTTSVKSKANKHKVKEVPAGSYTTVKNKNGKNKVKTYPNAPATVTKYKSNGTVKTKTAHRPFAFAQHKTKVKNDEYANVKVKSGKHKIRL